MAWCLV